MNDQRSPWVARLLVLALVVVVVLVTLNTLRTPGQSSAGIGQGGPMPPFAAPLALGGLEGDVNIATRETAGGPAGERPACEVRGPDVLNACDLWRDKPVALAFLASRGERCVDALDRLDEARARFPQVQFAAIAVRGGRDSIRELVRERGWGFPVGYDDDGVLANLYGVSVCPHLVLADRGGRVRETVLGEVTAEQLDPRLAALAR